MYLPPKNSLNPVCRELIIQKIIDARAKESKDFVDIYISRDDILTHFLSDDDWVCILDSVENGIVYRTEEAFGKLGENFDDEVSGYIYALHDSDLIISGDYICYDQSHRLRNEEKRYFKKELVPPNDGTDNPEGWITILSPPNESLVYYATTENLKFSAGWWHLQIAKDFELKIITEKFQVSDETYQVGNKCFVDIKNGLIVGEKGVQKISNTYGGKENKYYSLLYNLLMLSIHPVGSSLYEKAKKIIDKCTSDQCKELRSKFHNATDDQIVTFKDEELRFVYKKVASYKGNP